MMGLLNDLLMTFDNAYGHEPEGFSKVAPISHEYVSKNEYIDITIDSEGNIFSVEIIKKERERTLMAATENASSRSGTGADTRPYALNDKLKYMSPACEKDFSEEKGGKKGESDVTPYEAYREQLDRWNRSDYSCAQGIAVYNCITHCNIIDVIKESIPKILDQNGQLPAAYYDYFVRWKVVFQDPEIEPETWKNSEVMTAWTNYYMNTVVCKREKIWDAVTGEIVYPSTTQPKPIAAYGNSKLISVSAKEENLMHYTGERFTERSQLPQIGYITSQKIHNAIDWLCNGESRQAIYISKASLKYESSKEKPKILVCWRPSSPMDTSIQELSRGVFTSVGDDKEKYESMLAQTKALLSNGNGNGLKDQGVSVCIFDSSTDGRFSAVMYKSFSADAYISMLEDWHKKMAWLRYNKGTKTEIAKQLPLFLAAACASGSERESNGGDYFLEVDEHLFKYYVNSLFNSLLNNQPVSYNLVREVVRRSSDPMAYPHKFETVLYAACAIIRANYIDRGQMKGGEEEMALNRNNTDRSYLYGRMLAIYDKIEEAAMYKKAKNNGLEERDARTTKAQLYWSAFAKNPAITRTTIESLIRPYLDVLSPGSRSYYMMELEEIENCLSEEDLESNSPLSEMYLHGYYLERKYLRENKRKFEDPDNSQTEQESDTRVDHE